MKTITRLVLGLISSLLISAGLFRAASHLDPLHLSPAANPGDQRLAGPSPQCVVPCYFTPREMLSQGERHV